MFLNILFTEKRHILDAARRTSHSVQHNDVETGIHIKRHDSTDSGQFHFLRPSFHLESILGRRLSESYS